jgi:hypothetical protein
LPCWSIKVIEVSHRATTSQRIEISRKEQKEQKNNKCQSHQTTNGLLLGFNYSPAKSH